MCHQSAPTTMENIHFFHHLERSFLIGQVIILVTRQVNLHCFVKAKKHVCKVKCLQPGCWFYIFNRKCILNLATFFTVKCLNIMILFFLFYFNWWTLWFLQALVIIKCFSICDKYQYWPVCYIIQSDCWIPLLMLNFTYSGTFLCGICMFSPCLHGASSWCSSFLPFRSGARGNADYPKVWMCWLRDSVFALTIPLVAYSYGKLNTTIKVTSVDLTLKVLLEASESETRMKSNNGNVNAKERTSNNKFEFTKVYAPFI